MVEMTVRNVGLDFTGKPVVMLADKQERRLLPIWIGSFEATAIAAGLRGEKMERPFTHDLLYDVIANLGHDVARIVVTDLKDGTYYATVVLQQDGATTEVDARPSDAIALAIRAKATILVSEEVLDKAGILSDDAEQDEVEQFKKLLDKVELDSSEES
jgi:bifunctional DNase/RNase